MADTPAVDSMRYKVDKEIKLSKTSHPHVVVVNQLEPNTTVLDVGCSYGDLGALIKKAIASCTLYGLEYDAASVEVGRKSGIYEAVYQEDLNAFNPESYRELEGKFDYIIFADVLEHLADPLTVIRKFKAFLKPTGHFIASLPNVAHAAVKMNLLLNNWIYTETGILDRTHLRFFTHSNIAEFMTELNMSIEAMGYSTFRRSGTQPGHPWRKLPIFITPYIYANPHSFVLQYVVKFKESQIPTSEETQTKSLAAHNLKMMQLTYPRLTKKLKKHMARAVWPLLWFAWRRLCGDKPEVE